jgi:hypothetical protein
VRVFKRSASTTAHASGIVGHSETDKTQIKHEIFLTAVMHFEALYILDVMVVWLEKVETQTADA